MKQINNTCIFFLFVLIFTNCSVFLTDEQEDLLNTNVVYTLKPNDKLGYTVIYNRSRKEMYSVDYKSDYPYPIKYKIRYFEGNRDIYNLEYGMGSNLILKDIESDQTLYVLKKNTDGGYNINEFYIDEKYSEKIIYITDGMNVKWKK